MSHSQWDRNGRYWSVEHQEGVDEGEDVFGEGVAVFIDDTGLSAGLEIHRAAERGESRYRDRTGREVEKTIQSSPDGLCVYRT